jgi:hypothetical protein
MKISNLFRLSMFILVGSVLLSACQAGKPTLEDCQPMTPGGICVSITDDTCPSVIVAAEQQVTWLNQGKQTQTVRVETLSGEVKFMAEDLMSGNSASATFVEAGSYKLYCSAIPDTVGSLTVEP